jgi:hypothetical protein
VAGVRFIVGLVASTLALLLATHLVICPPTYDDDVCAAARIDYAVQFAAEKPAEVAKPSGEGPGFLAATLTSSLAAPWNPPLAAPAPESSLAMLASPTATRNSALAHHRTVVLIL